MAIRVPDLPLWMEGTWSILHTNLYLLAYCCEERWGFANSFGWTRVGFHTGIAWGRIGGAELVMYDRGDWSDEVKARWP